MTIAEVLRKVDMLKPNRFTKEQKIGWLDEIERQLWFDVVSTHENPMHITQRKYDVNSDPDIVLIAPPPYDEVYQLYIQCQIDLGNMEIAKYNNDKTLFNNALMSFRDYWNRTFMPCERAHCFAFDERRRFPLIGYHGNPLFSSATPLDNGHPHHPHLPMDKYGHMMAIDLTVPNDPHDPLHNPDTIKRIPVGFKPHMPMQPMPMNVPVPKRSVIEEIVQIHATDRMQHKQIKNLMKDVAGVHDTDADQENAINILRTDIAAVRETDRDQANDISKLKEDLADSTLTEMTADDIGEIIN